MSYGHPAVHPLRYCWSGAPPDWQLLAGLGATVLLLIESSVPSASAVRSGTGQTIVHMGALFLLAAAALDWLKRVARRVFWPSPGERRVPRPRGPRWRWAATPLCLAALVSATIADWPLRLRFAVSRSSFDAAAQSCLLEVEDRQWPRRVGAYWVEDVDEREGVVHFKTAALENIVLGFAYAPDRRPLLGGNQEWTALGRAWFVCVAPR